MAIKKPEVLAPQLIYAGVHAENDKEAVGMMALWKHLISYRELREPLIPLLESKDKDVRHQVAIWLSNIDGLLNRPAEDGVMAYWKTLLHKKESPAPGLINFLYFASPSQSLLLLGAIYSENPKYGEFPRPLMWSDHVIKTVNWRVRNGFLHEGDLEKAQKELDSLSKHEGWYARRYVVELIRDIPKFGTPDMIARLKKDPSPLVAEAAKLIGQPRIRSPLRQP